MFKFLDSATNKVWSNLFEDAEKELSEYKDKVPRAALTYAQCSILKSVLTSDISEKKEQKKRLQHVLTLCSKVNLDELAKLISEKNSEAQTQEQTAPAVIDSDEVGLGDEPKIEPLQIKDPPPVLTDVNIIKKLLPIEVKLIKGSTTLWTGMHQLHSGSYVKGAFNLRKAWGILYALYKDIQNKNDIHADLVNTINANVGTFFFFLSILPTTITKLLEVIGFVADREKGISLLKEVAEANCQVSPITVIVLALNYLFIPRALTPIEHTLVEYKPYLSYYLNKYPTSSFFRFLAAQFVRKTGDFSLSTKHTEYAIYCCEEILHIEQNIFTFELGQDYFIQREYEKAASMFSKLVENDRKLELKPIAALELCSCLYHLGKYEEIDVVFNGIGKYIGKKSRLDKLLYPIYESLRAYSKNIEVRNKVLGLIGYQIMYLRRDIAHVKKDEALKLLEALHRDTAELLDKHVTPDVTCSVQVIRAQIYQLIGEKEKYRTELLNVITHPQLKAVKQQVWIVSALYGMCELEYEEGNKKVALDYVMKALKYKGFAGEEVVRSRCQLAKKQIMQELK